MAPKVVRYYLSFGSPFAALADAQIDALVEEVGADLDPIPINAPPSEPPRQIAATLLDYRRRSGLPLEEIAPERPVERAKTAQRIALEVGDVDRPRPSKLGRARQVRSLLP